jgi:hypothetical protein
MNLSGDSDNRARMLLTIGLVCLVVAIGSKSLDLNLGLEPIPLHFLQGALLGFGFIAVLHAWWKTRRRP